MLTLYIAIVLVDCVTQGRLSSIIGPRAKEYTGAHIYTPTHRNKTVNVDKINIQVYLLYWYFQQNQCLNINKHDVQNIHRLAWGPCARGGPRANAQRAHALRRHWCYFPLPNVLKT